MKIENLEYKFRTIKLDKFGQVIQKYSKHANSLIFKLNEKTNLEMTEIPSGDFLMGSSTDEIEFRENETPQHKVKISKFYLGKYPITQSQYFAVMGELPEISEEIQNDNLPVVNVFLEKALEFCSKLSKITTKNFRLPTEAEWEYACRAGTDTPFCFGETITAEIANFDDNKSISKILNEKKGGLTPVGYFKFANNFGLYDMHGNVWEWCADIWHENYKNVPLNGSAWVEGGDQSYCVQRGGAWNSGANICRSAFRVGDIAHNFENIVGLRVCMTI